MAVRVVEEVDEHLADEHRVDLDIGKHGRDLEVDRSLPDAGTERHEGVGDEVEDRAGDGVDLEDASLESAHVEQAGHQMSQPVGLTLEQPVELIGVGRAEVILLIAQRRGGHLHRGERGPEVVGDRAEQVLPDPVDLFEQLGALGLRS